MKKQKYIKYKSFINNKEVKMATFPFKNEDQQKAGGLVIALFGLIILAISFNDSTLILPIGSLGISYGFIGFISFFIGLFYFIDSTA